tara:strand:+ start:614 stop:730 length:117 start_codon:yes stop_codon:yes gene_type:complete
MKLSILMVDKKFIPTKVPASKKRAIVLIIQRKVLELEK